MTYLKKAVRRAVEGIDRNGIVVTLYPNQTMGLRAKRTRTEHVLPLGRIYRWAVEATVEARRKHKADERERRRVERGGTPRRHLVRRGLL